MPSLWQTSPRFGEPASPARRCGSSVVEHSLGKGEVESSILSRSTSPLLKSLALKKLPGAIALLQHEIALGERRAREAGERNITAGRPARRRPNRGRPREKIFREPQLTGNGRRRASEQSPLSRQQTIRAGLTSAAPRKYAAFLRSQPPTSDARRSRFRHGHRNQRH